MLFVVDVAKEGASFEAKRTAALALSCLTRPVRPESRERWDRAGSAARRHEVRWMMDVEDSEVWRGLGKELDLPFFAHFLCDSRR
jgi:hypothetical protein